ncbi:transcriptional regulator FilR1 domain-containing protein [Methanolobus halotolerans]
MIVDYPNLRKKIKVEMVIIPDLFEKLKSESYDQFNELIESEKITFYVYCEEIEL